MSTDAITLLKDDHKVIQRFQDATRSLTSTELSVRRGTVLGGGGFDVHDGAHADAALRPLPQ
jgi:hypothetical protein